MRYIKFLFLFFIAVSFVLGCKKEKKEYTVRYRVQRINSGTSSYTVRYTTADGSSKSIGPITGDQFNSGELPGYKAKQYITLTLEGNGNGVYKMYIYTSSAPYKVRDADDNFGPQSLEMKIEE
jgi:hypothetical protein